MDIIICEDVNAVIHLNVVIHLDVVTGLMIIRGGFCAWSRCCQLRIILYYVLFFTNPPPHDPHQKFVFNPAKYHNMAAETQYDVNNRY